MRFRRATTWIRSHSDTVHALGEIQIIKEAYKDMSFLAPLAFLGGLIAIPIILLYMLRLRRREVTISSTFLWQQILQDKEANTPWQRLRRNLLLFLQLIILALMVLALARPFITVPAISSGQTALLLDASASMNALDVEGDGTTRFDAAKQSALEVVNTLSAGNAMTVIRVGSVPEVLVPYTTDRERLRTGIENARPGQSSGDWLAALTLAAAGGTDVEDFTVVIVGDGGIGDANNLPNIAIPGEVRFIQVGDSGENVALTALAIDALPGSPPQLFGQITNYSEVEAEVVLSLRVDDESTPIVSERYTIPASGALPIVSTEALNDDFEILEAELTLSVNSQANDFLPNDNTAWAVAGTAGARRVLILTEGNIFLEQVLNSMPSLEVFRNSPDAALPSQPFDLYIFDGDPPSTLPQGDLLIVNPTRSSTLYTVGAETEQIGEVSVAANDDRMAFVDFEDVSVLSHHIVEDTGWAEPLIVAENGPLLFAGEVEGHQVAVLTFDPRDSDLPLQITWPVLISNLLEWFSPSNVLAAGGVVKNGDAVVMRPPLEADTVRVTLPDGRTRDLPIERSTLIFTDTEAPGIYRLDILSGGEVIGRQVFAVNLFSPEESEILPTDVVIGNEIVTSEAREEPGQFEFWPWIALLALLVLLIEWYAYHRRLRVPTLLSGRRRVSTVPVR